jgi:predicted ArsR family transcriptional regulator
MLNNPIEDALADLAVLAEPVRRRLYIHVAESPDPISRDDAAEAVGISRSLAAFHLDRLVQSGLLEAEFRRLRGRSGPGAGRPSKLYRSTRQEVLATVPPRRYEIAAELFARALEEPGRGPESLTAAATTYGNELGQEARRRAGPRAGHGRRVEALRSVLRDAGYLPIEREGELRMLNCPFHELAQRHRRLTCGMNLSLLQGMLAGANLPVETARLDQQPGLCCVAIATA